MLLDQAQSALIVEVDAPPVCRHHWIIESANGRYSRGECLKCHEVRAFENSIYEGPEPDAE